MPQIRVLSKGARITAGALCLLFLLHTLYWLGHDLVSTGPGLLWDLWTGGASVVGDGSPGSGGLPDGAYPVTTPYEVGLAMVQGAAVVTAFAGRRVAGGLLAVATVLTFSLRVQAIVSTGTHTSDNRWFIGLEGYSNDPTLKAVFLSSGALVPLTLIAAVVLLAGMRDWPRPGTDAGTPPSRPAAPAGPVSAIALGVSALLWVVWICYVMVQALGSGYGIPLGAMFTGRGLLVGMLALAPGWAWATFLPLTAVAALLAATRRVSARGFAVGMALVLLPAALLNLCAYLRTGTLFEFGDFAPFGALLSRAQMLVHLAGSIAVLALMGRRGEPVQPGMPGMAGPGLPGFAVPGAPGFVGAPAYGNPGGPVHGGPMPGGPVHGGPAHGATGPGGYGGYQQPPVGPAPGGYPGPAGPSPVGPPPASPPPASPPPAPGGYPPPQGGFGPPPTG
ncbi:hypothetical protein [Streptomyces rimosus]|uniref:hypothetical protein n=1 Tax=Streptomyces rimosus TaxID=1927 RepID=UPI0004CC7047|nr:hypothetical protein [Streptomyces rimosus]